MALDSFYCAAVAAGLVSRTKSDVLKFMAITELQSESSPLQNELKESFAPLAVEAESPCLALSRGSHVFPANL